LYRYRPYSLFDWFLFAWYEFNYVLDYACRCEVVDCFGGDAVQHQGNGYDAVVVEIWRAFFVAVDVGAVVYTFGGLVVLIQFAGIADYFVYSLIFELTRYFFVFCHGFEFCGGLSAYLV
jgi:hypothetical protein